MNKSESIKEIASALVEVQKKITPLKKDKKNPFYKSSYVGLETVLPQALEILNAQGIALTQTVGSDDGGNTTLTTTLMHTSGEWLSDTQPLLLVKADPQGQGSAITYARRYGLMSAIGIVADEDDDGNVGSGTVHGESGLRIEHSQTYKELEARIKAMTRFDEINEVMSEIRKTPMNYSEKKELNALAVRQGGYRD